MSIYCHQCGREGRDGYKFCPSCGAELAEEQPAARTDAPPVTPQPLYASPGYSPAPGHAPGAATKILTILALCAAFFSLFCYLMPVLSVGWGISYSGLDMIEETIDSSKYAYCAYCVIAAMLSSGFGGIFAVAALKKPSLLTGTILFAIVGMACAFVSVMDDLSYIASGFILYELLQAAALALSIAAIAANAHAKA